MSAAPTRRQLSEAVAALVKTNQPTQAHYEAICKALGTVATQDFGIPIHIVMQADFAEDSTK